MISPEKNAELERHRAILLAAIDYHREMFEDAMVYDGESFLAHYYRQETERAEKHYRERRLDRLQKQLLRFTETFRHARHLEFGSYILERTGYAFDVFESLRRKIEAILAKKEISTEKEIGDVMTMLQIYEHTGTEAGQAEQLKRLISGFHERTEEAARTALPRKRKKEHREVTRTELPDGTIREHIVITTGSRPNQETESVSPDGKRAVSVHQWGRGHDTLTNVNIRFEKLEGAPFATKGLNPDVRAYWKDNHTVVIETGTDNRVIARHNEVRSFGDLVRVEYIERGKP